MKGGLFNQEGWDERKGLIFSDVTLVCDDDIAINVDHYGNFRLH